MPRVRRREVSQLAGFVIRPEEMRSLCRQFRREAQSIGEHRDQLLGTEVEAHDFGGRDHAEVGAAYVEVTRELLVDLLMSLRDNSSEIADRFEQSLAAYLRVDEDNRAEF